MIHRIYGDDGSALVRSMHRDRARQFRDRLGWPVTVDADGCERDQYDELHPLYIVATDSGGRHAGSMRCLPTTGRTMASEHFLHLTDGVRIESPLIWECTRFCTAPGAHPAVSLAVFAGCLEAALETGVEQAIGVFDSRMISVYRRVGHAPEVLGRDESGVCVGLWTVSEAMLGQLRWRLAGGEMAA